MLCLSGRVVIGALAYGSCNKYALSCGVSSFCEDLSLGSVSLRSATGSRLRARAQTGRCAMKAGYKKSRRKSDKASKRKNTPDPASALADELAATGALPYSEQHMCACTSGRLSTRTSCHFSSVNPSNRTEMCSVRRTLRNGARAACAVTQL